MRRKTIAVAALLAAVGVGAAACSHSSGGSTSVGANQARLNAPVAGAPSEPALAPGTTSSHISSGRDAAAVQHLVEQEQIRTAQMTVAVKGSDHVAQRADTAAAIAAQMGGEVTRDDRTSGRHATALLVLRVPPTQLEPTLQALSQLGTEKSRQVSTVDVTQRVADVASRVASARAAIAQLRDLYRRAVKVRDVIEVETQLASREADLESLEARARALANQTALATITLQLVTAAKPKPKPVPAKHYSGFVGGLERGWHAFTTAVAWLAVAIGALLPFLVVAALLAALAWQVRRRTRPRPSLNEPSE
jgi:hypothetical protein